MNPLKILSVLKFLEIFCKSVEVTVSYQERCGSSASCEAPTAVTWISVECQRSQF